MEWRWSRALRAAIRCQRGLASARRAAPRSSKTDVALEERRIVTVLFADLVGYTALAEHLDPEQVKRLVESCFERLVADIERVRRAGRQAARRRHRRPVRRAGRPRGRRRAGGAGGAADAGDARPLRRGDPGRPAADAHRHQHRRGAGRHPRRVRLHGDGRRREHRLAPAGAGPAGRRAGRVGHDRPVPAVDPPRAVRRHPHPRAASRTSSRGWSPAPTRRACVRCAATCRSSGATHERALLEAAVQLVRNGHSGVVSIIGEAGAGKSRLADEIIEPAGGRGDRAAHGVRAVRRRPTSGRRSSRASPRSSDSTPTPRPARSTPPCATGPRSCGAWHSGDPSCGATLEVIRYLLGHRLRRSIGSTPPAPVTWC